MVSAAYRRMLLIFSAILGIAVIIAIIFFALGQRAVNQGGLQSSDNSSLRVPEEQWPQDFNQRQQAPAFSLLPTRTAPATVSADIKTADIEPLLAAWENFSPQKIARAQHRRQPDPYRQRLQSVSEPAAIDDLYFRRDSSDLPTVCPQFRCSAGWRWLPGSLSDISVHDYQPPLAYITGYGLVQYRSDQGPGDANDQQIYYRAYGLIINNRSGQWRLQRVAAEMVKALN